MPSFIEDGYDVEGFIAAAAQEKASERLYDELKFTYRMAARSDIALLDNKIRIAQSNDENDPTCSAEAEKLACKFVADRVKSWSLKNSKGETVSITAENMGRVNPVLFGRLYRIVRGIAASDKRPDAEVPPTAEEASGN